jgi:hypothetical protein
VIPPRGPYRPSFRRALPRVILCATLALVGWTTVQAAVVPSLSAEAARLFRELAALRGRAAPGPPPTIVVTGREDRRRFVQGELARKYTPARIEAERRALIAWGLAPAGFDLPGFLADLLAEQVAAYYDPVAKRMILANWLTPELRRDALAHELVHALQDRLVDLDRFLATPAGHNDESLARQALVEGEAVALSYDRKLRQEGRDLAVLPDVLDLQAAIRVSASGPVVARAPRYLREVLTFPYAAGVGFLHAFRQRRPWRELDDVYRDPPRSSAQILRPERYFDRREDPVRIDLPDLAPLLPPGATRLTADDLGQFGLRAVLRQFLGDAATADGWRGDRYALWSVGSPPPLLVAITAWDGVAHAATFARAYAAVLAVKHALPPATDPDHASWTLGPRAFVVERHGAAVLLVEQAPAPALPSLRAALGEAAQVLH